MSRVAFLGLGRMGAPMAANLAAAGHDLVLHNRTPARAENLAARIGAETAASPRDAAAHADVVLTMLADAAALLDVHERADGILAGVLPGAIVVDMGTTGPEAIGRLAPRVAAAGGVLVDAPVSGSTAAAESATLTMMVGAPDAALATVQPILESMGRVVHHLGDTGAGSVAKLAVNNVIYALGNALSESLVMAERAGLDRARIYDVFEDSAVAAPMISYRRAAYLDPDGTPTAFAMVLARKDLELITRLAASVDLPVDQATANLGLIGKAVAAGLGDHDMAEVAVYLRGA